MSGKNNGTMARDLTVGSVPRQLISFAAPLFFSGLLQTVYNMVDMVVVGRFVGAAGLSAVAVGGEVLTFLTFIAMGVSNAGQVIISQYLGAGRREKISKLIGTLFSFLLGCAVLLTAACLALEGQILNWVNAPPESLEYARDYVGVCVWGLVFIYGYNLVSAILRGMGDSKRPFLFIAIASAVNLVLDLAFIAGLGMGAFGAALATVLGQSLSFLCAIALLYRKKEQFGFDFKPASFRIDKEAFAALIKLGVPMVLQSAAISFSKLFITSWVNTYGVIASAVTGIGNKLQTVTNVFAQALSTAGGSMIAQNIGAEKYERVPRIIGVSFALDSVVAMILSVVTLLFPRTVFGFFTQDEAVLDMAISYIPVAVLMYASCVLRPPMTALINGSGYARLNLTVALLDGLLVRIGLAYVMGRLMGLGIYGFWYGNALSSFVPFLIGGAYFLSGKWKTRRHIIQE